MSALEHQLRQRIMDALAERTAGNGGVVRRDELAKLPIGDGEERRLIDPGGAGIRFSPPRPPSEGASSKTSDVSFALALTRRPPRSTTARTPT